MAPYTPPPSPVRERITVTSSLQQIIYCSTDQRLIRAVLREETETVLPHPFQQQASGQIFKDNLKSYSSTSGFFFIELEHSLFSNDQHSKIYIYERHIREDGWAPEVYLQDRNWKSMFSPMAALCSSCSTFLSRDIWR
jgi:hypothetical protein